MNASKTECKTEIAFVNKEDDPKVPIGHPGSQSHLPKLRNHQHKQLTQTQDVIFLIPSSAISQVVVVMLVLRHGRLQALEFMKAKAKVAARCNEDMSIEKGSEERNNSVIKCDKELRNFNCRAKSLSRNCDWNGKSNSLL